MASSSDVKIKKKTKNTAQKRTQPLRNNKYTFDMDTNPALSKWFDRVSSDRRLKNQKDLRSYLEKRYQFPIAK